MHVFYLFLHKANLLSLLQHAGNKKKFGRFIAKKEPARCS